MRSGARALVVGLMLACAWEAAADSPSSRQSQANARVVADLPLRGESFVSLAVFSDYVESRYPSADPIYLRVIFRSYERATRAEGVSLVVALAQMIHETDFLRFTGAVSPIQYNFAGIGSVAAGVAGDRFPNVSTGVLAHVQHLRAYSDTEPLSLPLVDPRFAFVERGSAPTVHGLTGRWATDPAYAEKVLVHARRLLEMQALSGIPLRRRR